MGVSLGQQWLDLAEEGDHWRLPVASGVLSGASALFGGCATAAALVIAQHLAEQPVVWAAAHFGALAKAGATVALTPRVISAGRTMTHIEVTAVTDGRESFTARVAAGDRSAHEVQGHWPRPPQVADIASAARFDHPVHADTWASRFVWRLAGTCVAPHTPWAAWWVRSLEPVELIVEAAVLCDYVTYGMGRALRVPMGGLSIDNVLRVHRHDGIDPSGWRLLEIRPDAIAGGFGAGTARLFSDSSLVATGTQSTITNTWDWRLPDDGR